MEEGYYSLDFSNLGDVAAGVPESAVSSSGNFWGGFGSTLNGALSRWIDVETVKALQGAQPQPNMMGYGQRPGTYPVQGGMQQQQEAGLLPLLLIGALVWAIAKD